MTAYSILLDARLALVNDPGWGDGRGFDGSPSLVDGYRVLERANAHLGIRAYDWDSSTRKFFPEEC